MAWLPSHQELRDHPKVRRLAAMLDAPRAHVIGHLHCLWWWALSYAPDGDVSEFDDLDLALAAEWPEDPHDFVTALMECGPRGQSGFLDADRRLHDWDEYAGRYDATKRAADGVRGNHVRWHERRGVVDPECPICRPESGGDSHPDREANRRGEERRGETTPPPERAEGFLDWWAGYPRKVGRAEAEAAFAKALKRGATCDKLTTSLAQWRQQWEQENRPTDKIPHASTWLNRDRWQDDLAPTGTSYETPQPRYV